MVAFMEKLTQLSIAALLGVTLILLATGLPQPFLIILSLSKSNNMVWFCCAGCICQTFIP